MNQSKIEAGGTEQIAKEGDDTMSAVTQNYVYHVCGKKDTDKKEPTVTKDRLERIKASVGKYLSDKKL